MRMMRLKNNQKKILILAGSILFVLGAFILASSGLSGIGYPLDDAWIHQTYARNLAVRGEWAFLPGKASAGSTAPLWSALIAPAYLFVAGPSPGYLQPPTGLMPYW